jgi:hypothetical protein
LIAYSSNVNSQQLYILIFEGHKITKDNNTYFQNISHHRNNFYQKYIKNPKNEKDEEEEEKKNHTQTKYARK